jgi:hypothetical protein
MPIPIGEAHDRRRRVWPDARDFLQLRDITRELPAILVHDHDCRPEHIPPAGVVAQARVVLEEFFPRGGCQRLDRRKALKETRVVADDARHLRLLEHDLTHPHFIRRDPRFPPRQFHPPSFPEEIKQHAFKECNFLSPD